MPRLSPRFVVITSVLIVLASIAVNASWGSGFAFNLFADASYSHANPEIEQAQMLGCTPTELIVDGTFEAGPSWPAWSESSTHFGTPLCSVAICGTGNGTSPPFAGSHWAWFGGTTGFENATLTQNFTVPAGTGLVTLSFRMRNGAVTPPQTGSLVVYVNGGPEFIFHEGSVPEASYTLRSKQLGGLVFGQNQLRFEYLDSNGISSFAVDNVSIMGCLASTPTNTPTRTPTNTPTTTPTNTATATPTPETCGEPRSAVDAHELIGLEVTQGVQDMGNRLPLIEGKTTVVRAHVRRNGVLPTFETSATLTARNAAGNIIGTKISDNGRIPLPVGPQRVELNESFYFTLPTAWTSGNVELSFAGNELPFACAAENCGCDKITAAFQAVRPLKIKFVLIPWQDIFGTVHPAPTITDLLSVVRTYEARFPMRPFNVSHRPMDVWPIQGDVCFFDPRNLLRSIRVIESLSQPELSEFFYQGLVSGPTGCHAGAGDIGGKASWSIRTGDSATHELGHNLGLCHTYTGNGENCSGGTCPSRTGLCGNVEATSACTTLEGHGDLSEEKRQYNSFAVYGYDLADTSRQRTNIPAATADFMSYDSPRWLSRCNYNHLFNLFALPPLPLWENQGRQSQRDSANCTPAMFQIPADPNQNRVSANQRAVISGSVHLDGSGGNIGAFFQEPTAGSVVLPSTGVYSIRLENSAGAEVARFNFDPTSSSEGNTNIGHFAFVIPWDPSASRIVLLHNENVLDFRQASSQTPTINVIFPNGGEVLSGPSATLTWAGADADGDPLTYSVQYSIDNGVTWQVLALELNSASLTVDLTALAGSNQALIRVSASDGFNSARSQSQGTFTVSGHAPTAHIFSPEENQIYAGVETAVLDGMGLDVEDGLLEGSNLTWISDLDGPLGTGRSLVINVSTLQEGTHAITLTATDIADQAGSATISVSVFRIRPPQPAILSAAPNTLSFRLKAGQSQNQALAIRNHGDGDLVWSAAANQPWINLAVPSGSAPHNLDVTANTAGLSPGLYSGQVAITAPGVGGSPQVIAVGLLVQPNPSPAISGAVTYGNAIGTPTPRFVSNVLISGSGSTPVSVFTDTAGGYSLTGFGAGSYTVTPSKTGGVNDAISSFDAAKIAQHALGSVPLTGNQLLVADVSGNGIITSFDAGQIARFVLGSSPFGSAGTWRFIPVNRSYASVSSNVTGEDYSALLMGEVSGNWVNSGLRPEGRSEKLEGSRWNAEGDIVVSLPNMAADAKEITVPVSVKGVADRGIISYEFDLRYDPSVIQPSAQPVDVAGTVSRGLVVVTNASEPGLLRVVVYGAFPIDSDGVLLNLRFAAVGAGGSVSPLAFERMMFNEGETQVALSDGEVRLF